MTKFGGPDSLHLMELPVPEAGEGEIRIRVSAATVNPVDAMVRRGQAFVSDAEPPYVPGMEAAGIVDQVGPGVLTGVRIGDRVSAIAVTSGTHGAYAEYLVVPAESAVLAPPGASDAQAATLAMNGLTARMALDLLQTPERGTVAVTGAAGAVGGYAVQLAKADGLRVIADAAPKDERLVNDLGVDIIVPRGSDFAEQVRKHAPEGVDGLVDSAGVSADAARSVRDGGRVATSAGGELAAAERERGVTIQQTFVPNYARDHARLERLRQLAEEDRLTLRVARILPAEQAVVAHRLLEQGGLRGRVVLIF
ncbi:zinc-binding alcohol dehydrogenase family protein [Streptomyces sp. KL116D]|uniref:quinone oxidoreductase family protein n=1 Tax=Streptomyces sp. KL116D TaxID=3045152 RepID=UPI00355843B9